MAAAAEAVVVVVVVVLVVVGLCWDSLMEVEIHNFLPGCALNIIYLTVRTTSSWSKILWNPPKSQRGNGWGKGRRGGTGRRSHTVFSSVCKVYLPVRLSLFLSVCNSRNGRLQLQHWSAARRGGLMSAAHWSAAATAVLCMYYVL